MSQLLLTTDWHERNVKSIAKGTLTSYTALWKCQKIHPVRPESQDILDHGKAETNQKGRPSKANTPSSEYTIMGQLRFEVK